MKLFKKLAVENFFLIFTIVYLLLRIGLFNINYVEWGDTFRMIRAAEFLSTGVWPWDEKRWPFYSILLIPGIFMDAAIAWGRVLSFTASIGTFVLTYQLYLKLNYDFRLFTSSSQGAEAKRFSLARFKNWFREKIITRDIKLTEQYGMFAVVLLALSPVYAYWSIRVMADPIFAFLIILYAYFFAQSYQGKKEYKTDIYLSLLLLCITMTRLEGIFMLFGTAAFFIFTKDIRKLVLYMIPQVLIYFPWTLYAKFLYNGPVNNDYLKEAETFVFNLARFNYFFTYTTFILVFPPLVYFIILGIIRLKNEISRLDKNIYLPYLPLVLFILQELAIGFIWTPSLPRIYSPIIPFLVILAVYGFQLWQPKKTDYRFFSSVLLFTILFACLQYIHKLYFLGASKILFGLVLLASLSFLSLATFGRNFKFYLGLLIICISAITASVVIYNQKDIYKSVLQGALLARDLAAQSPHKERIAYADETGTTSWYLKNDYTYYLEQNESIEDLDEQYEILTNNEVTYLIVTNEFNRGSQFLDPKNDPRYELVAVFSVPVYDLLDYMLNYFGLMDKLDSDVFVTKVYRIAI